MENHNTSFLSATHKKFAAYKTLNEQSGPEQARIEMLKLFADEQINHMMPFIAKATLAEGVSLAIPFFKSIGMEMIVVDISNNGTDAALEIHKHCPYMKIAGKYGFATPCHIFCEIEMDVTLRAFPSIKAEIISRMAYDSSVCIFKYERRAR
ncbi:MAG: L-2-amino-thiazoline-4-carboxylic acid hydrolase [Chlorobiaceae bacterium]|jgi:hypothetical protein|nr:L-2-amino-thiazoline-4-carboxylic acid hydrolase [Chlorobiaceae bacterium]